MTTPTICIRTPAVTAETSPPARGDALALLARRAYGAGEMKDRLIRKGYAAHMADEAVEWLSSLGYLDDEAYARELVQGYTAKGFGSYRIRGELLARSLDAGLADLILGELPPAGEVLDGLIAQLSAGRDLDDPKQRRRLVDALGRRGFAWEDIKEALERLFDA